MKFVGDCRHEGDSPQFYPDRDCERRCSTSPDCTGYAVSLGPAYCYIYTSVVLGGDGDDRHECYKKICTFTIKNIFLTEYNL